LGWAAFRSPPTVFLPLFLPAFCRNSFTSSSRITSLSPRACRVCCVFLLQPRWTLAYSSIPLRSHVSFAPTVISKEKLCRSDVALTLGVDLDYRISISIDFEISSI
jgi:hypothetical protein